jgi:transcriptional regulator with XRE-family HTH domain
MHVKDPKQIKKLMIIQGISARQLAEAIGYRSHAYVTRILRGEITNVTPMRAALIANYLQVGVDDLFLPRTSSDARQNVQRRVSA